MKYRIISMLMVCVLLFALAVAAFAVEETGSEVTDETPAATAAPAAADGSEEETAAEVPAETPVPVEAEEPAEAVAANETQETADIYVSDAGEESVQETGEEQPVEEDPYPDADHDDPMYWEMLERADEPVADGLSSSYSSFTPRTLDNETLYYGIDVSNWQGSINWSAVAASGVQFVIIRGGYRGVSSGVMGKDSCFKSYIEGAKAAGLLVGVYFYSQAITEAEGREEAQYLIDLCSGYQIDLPLVIDYEYYGTSGRLYNAHLSKQAATNICNAFCDTVESAGYQSMVYANLSMLYYSFYKEQLGRVWLAHFTRQTSYSGDYEYWQPGYGSISGISGSTDLDFWFRPNNTAAAPASTAAPSASAATPAPVSNVTAVLPADEEQEKTAEPSSTPAETSDPSPAPEETKEPSSTSEETSIDPSHPFTDVTTSDWFYNTVYEAYDLGIVNGVGETLFSPNSATTRGQTITMIYRMMGQPEVAGQTQFTDLTETYYVDAVAWGVNAGIVKGISTSSFAPNGYISRQDLAVMLYRLDGEPEQSGDLGEYSDVDSVKSYARSAMIWAVSNGIITGYDDGMLHPTDQATRAQICTMLMRYRAML